MNLTKSFISTYLTLGTLFLFTMAIGTVNNLLSADNNHQRISSSLKLISQPIIDGCSTMTTLADKKICTERTNRHNNFIQSEAFSKLALAINDSPAFQTPKLLAFSFHAAHQGALLRNMSRFHQGMLNSDNSIKRLSIIDIETMTQDSFTYAVYTTMFIWGIKLIISFIVLILAILLMYLYARHQFKYRQDITAFIDKESVMTLFRSTISDKGKRRTACIIAFTFVILFAIVEPTLSIFIY